MFKRFALDARLHSHFRCKPRFHFTASFALLCCCDCQFHLKYTCLSRMGEREKRGSNRQLLLLLYLFVFSFSLRRERERKVKTTLLGSQTLIVRLKQSVFKCWMLDRVACCLYVCLSVVLCVYVRLCVGTV